jgi:flagellar hook-associated protein 2
MSTSSVSSSTSSSSTAGLSTLTGSSTLQITGLASGLNTDQIINELMQVQEQPLTALQSQQSGVKAQVTQLTSIQTALQKVASDAQALMDPSLFHTSQAVTSSDSTRVSAASSTGAGVGGYQVSVSQLANSAQRTYTYASPTAGGTVTIDGHDTTVTAGESITDFVNSVNNDSSATVYAAATDSGTVVFSNRQTGDTGSNYIDMTANGGALTEQTSKAREGQDAIYSVDGGASQTSSSNTVTGAIAGVTLTLSGVTTTSGPVTVNVAAPAASSSNIATAMQQFITDYNSAISTVQTQLAQTPSSSDPTQGTLYGDPQLQDLLSSMRSAMYQTITGSATGTGMQSLLDIGVSTGATTGTGSISQSAVSGNLALNSSTLASALQSNPQGFQQVMEGWADSFSLLVNDASGAGGTIDNRIQGDDTQVSDMSSRITDMQAALTDKQNALVTQFAQLEATLSSNQSTSSWLTSQIAALPTTS